MSEPFNEAGYLVFNFQFPIDEYYLDMIETIINYLSLNHNIVPYETKIILQSNIRNLLIAWFRLYNDVIDDFVLVDRNMLSFQTKNTIESDFILQLSSLFGIEKDPCHDHLYYRYSYPISPIVLKSFMENYQYNLLKPFQEIDLHSMKHKRKFEKGYKYNNQYYKKVTAGDTVDLIIDLNVGGKFQNNIQINEITKPSGYFFTILYILDLPILDNQKVNAVAMLHQRMNDEDKRKVTEYVLDYLAITEEKHSFKNVINLYSFLTMLGTEKTIMKRMMKYIKKDENHLDDHYAPFTNVLFYITKANQEEYEDYFLDRVEIMRNLKAYYKPKLKIKANRSPNHLVIVVGQLLSYNHAPTKIAIDYANNLLKSYPSLKIKIVVEDMFNYSPNELFFVYPFFAADSSTLSREHKNLLYPSIEIHYSNSNLSRKKRLQDDIKAIIDFKPQWILKIGAPDSLAVDQLYDYYPVSSLSMGGAEYSEYADVYTSAYSQELIKKEYIKYKIQKRKYHQLRTGFSFLKKSTTERIPKSDESVFLVTVGNRLSQDLSEHYVDELLKVLNNNPQVVWFIVGTNHHEYINKKYSKQVADGKIKYIPYEEDLMEFYSICDIYLNPFRKGGGISIAMAMSVGLPVVCVKGDNDGAVYVDQQNCFDEIEYFNQVELLIKSESERHNSGNVMKKRIMENFNVEKTITQLLSFFEESEVAFKSRKLEGRYNE